MIKEMYQEYEHKMKKTVEVVISDFGGVRAGRANASVLDRITVEYYGTETPHQPGRLHLRPRRPHPGHPALGRHAAQGH